MTHTHIQTTHWYCKKQELLCLFIYFHWEQHILLQKWRKTIQHCRYMTNLCNKQAVKIYPGEQPNKLSGPNPPLLSILDSHLYYARE